jgi:hypothetical protein
MWSTLGNFYDYFSILGITYGLLAAIMGKTLSHIDKEREFTKETVETNISQQIS